MAVYASSKVKVIFTFEIMANCLASQRASHGCMLAGSADLA
jgi:hypothetical protein